MLFVNVESGKFCRLRRFVFLISERLDEERGLGIVIGVGGYRRRIS